MLVHQEDFQKIVKDSYSDNSQEVFFCPVEICNKKGGGALCRKQYHTVSVIRE